MSKIPQEIESIIPLFSTRLQRLRKSVNKNQEDMAFLLNLSRSYYSNLENGTGIPSLQTITRIKNFFNCSYDYLLGASNVFSNTNIEMETNIIELIKEVEGLRFGELEIDNFEKEKIIEAFKYALNILNLNK